MVYAFSGLLSPAERAPFRSPGRQRPLAGGPEWYGLPVWPTTSRTRASTGRTPHAYYANRVRGQRPPEEVDGPADEDEAPKKRRCSPSWARLISKVYQADPLVCRQCGGPLKVVAYVTDELSITRILDLLGLSPLQQEKPPPAREVARCRWTTRDASARPPHPADLQGASPAPGAGKSARGAASHPLMSRTGSPAWRRPRRPRHTTATFTQWIGGSESNRQLQSSPPSRPIQS